MVKRGDAGVLRHTSEQEPDGSASYFAFDEVQTFVRGFFVHAERDGDLRCLAKCSVLSGIMAFAEVINTIARDERIWPRVGRERGRRSQVTNYDMHRRRWVVRGDRNVTTGFVAGLRQFTYCESSHGEVRSR